MGFEIINVSGNTIETHKLQRNYRESYRPSKG